MSLKVKPVTIVVPVYADWQSLHECIKSLMQHVDTKQNKIMLVNDCGPDADAIEDKIKNEIKSRDGFHYFRNDENLGFIGTCNRAVYELDGTDNDILLLNSDTKTTEGFLEEMRAVLYLKEDYGVVSPRSNNATIATIPLSAAQHKGIDAKESYAIFKKMKKHLPRYNEVPVAHGFCMLIRRDLIVKYGLFDPVFGKGYGEEVDFCMRIAKDGYKSLLSNHSYVFHVEAKSFTLEKKAKMLEQNNKVVWARYPQYRQQVRDYMKKALTREKKIEESAGVKSQEESSLKGLLKKSSKLKAPVRYLRKLKNRRK